MHLDPLYYKVLPQLNDTGSTDHARGVLALKSIDVGYRHFDVTEGISYEISLFNTSEAILLSGVAHARLTTNCDRCLETAYLSISGEIQGYYLFDPTLTPSEEKLEVYELVDAEGRMDIAPPILAAVVFELPMVILCRQDCAGIVAPPSQGSGAGAGAELKNETDGINPISPFAALKSFKFEE